MNKYDNDNQVILSKVDSTNPNAPHMRINFEINGQKYKAGLWLWKRKDGSLVTDPSGNKMYKGKVEVDDYVRKPKPEIHFREVPAAADFERDAEDFHDDKIPF